MKILTRLKWDENYFTIDIEADGLRPTVIWCVVVQNVKTGEVFTFKQGDLSSFTSFVRKHPDAIWVGHNIISFDAPVLKRLWGVELKNVVDTLVLSYLYHPHIPGGHSLEAWGGRFSFPKIEFEDWSQFSEEMLEYCIQDVRLTTKLYKAISERMLKRGYSEKSVAIEHYARSIADQQESNGFFFDVPGATALYNRLRASASEAEQRIHALFPPELVPQAEYEMRRKQDGTPYAQYVRHTEKYPRISFNASGTKYTVWDWQTFNLGSPKQRVERLLSLGWEPDTFTPAGNPKVDEEALVRFAEESGVTEVKALADWLVLNGRANMINTWLECLDPSDSCIHGRVFTCGAGTRRMRHQKPNTANIPGEGAEYGMECRALWRAREGRVLVGVDAKGLEGRVFADYLNSEEGAKFFLEGNPHQSNADAVSDHLGFLVGRKPAKNLFYARLYGASLKKLGSMVGGGLKEGRKIRKAIDGNIPGFEELVESVEQEYKRNNGWLECVDGGWVRCPSPHAALNYKFQSAGAIIMKVASAILDEDIRAHNIDTLKVGDIHDEWQFDTHPDHAELLASLACDAITRAGEFLGMRIKLEGDAKIGANWAETH